MAFGPLEIILIAIIAVVVLVLGPKKIPEFARSIGLARKEFQAGTKEAAATSSGSSATGMQSSPPKDDLIETARKLGISTEGKTRQQISDEIVKRVGAYS